MKTLVAFAAGAALAAAAPTLYKLFKKARSKVTLKYFKINGATRSTRGPRQTI